MKLMTYDPAKKKMVLVGYWNKDKKLLGRKVGPQHFMRVLQGYGIQNDVFQQIIKSGIKHIALKEIHTGDILLSNVKSWLNEGRVKDYGHGKQRFLSVKYMRRKRAKDKSK